jgi:hypothetical protein
VTAQRARAILWDTICTLVILAAFGAGAYLIWYNIGQAGRFVLVAVAVLVALCRVLSWFVDHPAYHQPCGDPRCPTKHNPRF